MMCGQHQPCRKKIMHHVTHPRTYTINTPDAVDSANTLLLKTDSGTNGSAAHRNSFTKKMAKDTTPMTMRHPSPAGEDIAGSTLTACVPASNNKTSEVTRETVPIQSKATACSRNERRARIFVSRTTHAPTAVHTMPIGTLYQNIQRQFVLASTPPMTGPRMAPLAAKTCAKRIQ